MSVSYLWTQRMHLLLSCTDIHYLDKLKFDLRDLHLTFKITGAGGGEGGLNK